VRPLSLKRKVLLLRQLQALWITVNPNGKALEAGQYPIEITLKAHECTETIRVAYNVMDAELGEQDFLCTNWLHCDCIADRYGCEVFSERFWTLLGKYLKCAAQNGQNMVLTPCFTPPLDTPVGGERRTVQLVDVARTENSYQFNFSKLERFTKLAEKNGIHYFEHSHLFTQWGAEHAPKIMGTENGEYTRLFGWETDANSDEYRDFLTAYLTALKGFLDASGIGKRMYFHISDEPAVKQLESYGKARRLLGNILSGYMIFDALSHKEFWEERLLDAPVVVTSNVESFADSNCDNLWAYYTGGQCYDGLSNRLIATPPPRNRIIGFQMYRHHIKGFLHWGYNFWYTTLSRDPYDPLLSPDASGHFVGGTSYLVYPGTDGPIASMRQEVFRDALQDIRLCQLAEQRVGREAVETVLEKHFPGLDFHTCPVTSEPLLACRAELLELIK